VSGAPDHYDRPGPGSGSRWSTPWVLPRLWPVTGPVVDHDHFSGLVRGLLCLSCHAHLDDCCHVAHRPWADYLNHPPAASLNLLYPKRDTVARSPGARIRAEILGFNPLNNLVPADDIMRGPIDDRRSGDQ
jgi:hypothetical protein